MVNTREIAAGILIHVIQDGVAFHPQLISSQYPHRTEEYGFIAHLCFGVLRHYFELQALLYTLLAKPLKPKDFDLQVLLMIGLYELFYTDTPAYACIHSAVEVCVAMKKQWAKGLINGVLRQASRNGKPPFESSVTHPKWLVKQLKAAWPQNWEAILTANQQHPPFSLRVNLNHFSREEYMAQCEKNGLHASLLPCSSGIVVSPAVSVHALPGFDEGWASVQDGAAQWAPALLELKPGQRVLDACAAPGGKTAHMAEMEPRAMLFAIEKDPMRFARLQDAQKRGKFQVQLICNDACCPEKWWDGQVFDAILLDAPCSATGVIRRHPDIKHHRKAKDIEQLVKEQALLLEKLWPLLKPNGILLYVTCSVLPKENSEQVTHFLQHHPDAKEYPFEATWGIPQLYGRQIFPGEQNMDGFYYARLKKQISL